MKACRMVLLAIFVLMAGKSCVAMAPAADYVYFFTETGNSFEAFMDQANVTLDADSNRVLIVKLLKFSGSFRNWIKTSFPGGETADYAIDSYTIDCNKKTIGENRIVWYDPAGTELTDYDFGGRMVTPIVYSMKDVLMKRVCGIR